MNSTQDKKSNILPSNCSIEELFNRYSIEELFKRYTPQALSQFFTPAFPKIKENDTVYHTYNSRKAFFIITGPLPQKNIVPLTLNLITVKKKAIDGIFYFDTVSCSTFPLPHTQVDDEESSKQYLNLIPINGSPLIFVGRFVFLFASNYEKDQNRPTFLEIFILDITALNTVWGSFRWEGKHHPITAYNPNLYAFKNPEPWAGSLIHILLYMNNTFIRFLWPYYDQENKAVSILQSGFSITSKKRLACFTPKQLGKLAIKTKAGSTSVQQFNSAYHFSFSWDATQAFIVTSQAKLTLFVRQKKVYISKGTYNLSELLMCNTKKIISKKQEYIFKRIFRNNTLMLRKNERKSLGIWHVVSFKHINKMAKQQRRLSLPILVETAPTNGRNYLFHLNKHKNIDIPLAKREGYQASYANPDQCQLLANIKNKQLIVSSNILYTSKTNKKGNPVADQIRLKLFRLMICTGYIRRFIRNPIIGIIQMIANFYMTDFPDTMRDRIYFLKLIHSQRLTLEEQTNSPRAITMPAESKEEDSTKSDAESSIESCAFEYTSEDTSEDSDPDETCRALYQVTKM